MASKSKIKQQAMKNAIRIWELKSGEQLDPVINMLIESFCQLIYENENSIEDIRERLLEQIAHSLTPDNLIAAKPAHSIMRATPLEPEMEINRQTNFYTEKITNTANKYALRTLSFAPVADNIKLVRGEILHLLCERNLYAMGIQGEKELLTRANSFYQDLNRTVWIGFDLDKSVTSLKDIHFFIDFPNTNYKYDLFTLLNQTVWKIDDKELSIEPGIAEKQTDKYLSGGIFSHYNILQMNDEEIMDLYRKQFLHIRNPIRTSLLEKSPFPEELTPFFPERVRNLEPQYWLKVVFPPYFKKEDLEDITIHMNAFPVSNKQLQIQTLYANKNLTGTLPLPVNPGEFFLAVGNVEDSFGNSYTFLPYSISQTPFGGTYTIKRGGLERFSKRDLKDMVEQFMDLFRSELATFRAVNLDNINNSVAELERIVNLIREKMERNSHLIQETPTYLLIEPEDDKKNNDINAHYWTTNCDIANGIAYGVLFSPLNTIPLEKNSCFLLKTTAGGKTVPKKDEMLIAYKYALSARDQLFSARDIENFCYMKFSERVERVKVSRGIACSNRQKEGLIRTVDVNIEPAIEFKGIFDKITLGELKTELEKRSPDTYKYRILVDNTFIQ